jgi:hypothetical protein
MIRVRLKSQVMQAQQVTINNIEYAAQWCNGAIKGTSLPVERQEIDIVHKGGEAFFQGYPAYRFLAPTEQGAIDHLLKHSK